MTHREDWIPQTTWWSRPRQAGYPAHGPVPGGHRVWPDPARIATTGYPGQHAHDFISRDWAFVATAAADVLFELRPSGTAISTTSSRRRTADCTCMGQRRRFPGHTFRARWRQPRPPVQAWGAPLHGGEPVLVQCLKKLTVDQIELMPASPTVCGKLIFDTEEAAAWARGSVTIRRSRKRNGRDGG